MGMDSSRETDEFFAQVRRDVLAVVDGTEGSTGAISTADSVDGALDEINSEGEPKRLVKTGIGTLDREFGGLWPGLLTVMASRPSMGKSCTAVNIATNAALAGKRVLLVSLEDSRRFVLFRILSRLASVPLDRIVNRRLSDEERGRLAAQRDIVSCLPLHIDETPAMTAEQVRRLAMAHQDRHGLDLLVIDHLGHIRDKGRDLYESTTAAARTIAALPKELGIPVLLLSQLNRQNLQRTDKIPNLGDLRQTGELEQLARVVWLLHRPHYYSSSADPHELSLLVAKNSHGRTGALRLQVDLEHMFIGDQQKNVWAPPARAGEEGY